MRRVNLAEAKARLSELVAEAEAGGTVEIMRRGKVVARITAAEHRAAPVARKRQPIDVGALRKLTADMPRDPQDAGEFVRWMRDTDRY